MGITKKEASIKKYKLREAFQKIDDTLEDLFCQKK